MMRMQITNLPLVAKLMWRQVAKDEIKGTGAGQWSFYIEDDDGQLSTKDPNGTVVDVVEVDDSKCVADTNACYRWFMKHLG